MTRKIATADCETDPFKHGRIPAPFIWGFFDGDDYQEFNNTDDFINYVSELDIIIYAHNGGKFDWFYCLHKIACYEPIMVIAGRLAKFKIGRAEFRDSYNILPVPLSAYKKDDIDYGIMEESERNKPENRKIIQSYLKSDCVYLHELITRFISDYGMNLTVAGAAMRMHKKISDIEPPRCSPYFYDRINPFYYGGRVECFKSGLFKKEFKVIDINSAYPFAMTRKHPYGESYVISDKLPKTEAYIERSFITVKCVSLGAFPMRGKSKLEFPNDNISRIYFITGWEYLAAVRTGTILKQKIIEVMTFPDSIEFNEYVNFFFKLKSDSKAANDKAGYVQAKLFLNSLYGKYGSNPEKYKEYEAVPTEYIEAVKSDGYSFCTNFSEENALVCKPLEDEKKRFFNPAVAASITGFVRAYLWESICQCKGVMYCDTDSIICEDTGNLEIDPILLGAWDIEAECTEGAIAGKKMYAVKKKNGEYKKASKGGILSPTEIYSLAKGVPITLKSDAPVYSLKNGIKFVNKTLSFTA